ncbi:MAG: anaerobic ribonucleoside-triphosphate reductase activating protein [Desulfobacterales bacterium]|nr:anaerobic ribonucleoside-triphosphate reductase activating protein [Desulfobacterales bacterium]
MNFGGIQKSSLIDFPGKTSCVLFLTGCNFDCPYCHNPDLATGCTECPAGLMNDGHLAFLEERKDFLDGVVISGGEPTLQKDLFLLCRQIKHLGFPVKLDTNGSRPECLKALIDEELVDYIAMDIKTDPAAYSPVIKKEFDPGQIISSINIILKSGINHEFRTTCLKPFINEAIIEKISRLISGAKLYALQQCHQSRVLHPDFFKKTDYHIDDDELVHFKKIAEPWVQKCIVR